MSGCLRGCSTLAVLLLLGGGVAWLWGPNLLDRLEDWREAPDSAAPSAETGRSVVERFERFLEGGSSSEVAFSAVELESVIRFQFADRLPEGVTDPTVRLRGGEATLGLRVAREWIPQLPELEGMHDFLPDTVPVQLRGRVIGIDSGDAGFVVNRVEAASIPIPDRFIPRIAAALAPGASDDLPPEIIRIVLPEGIHTVRIDEDRLILSSGA